MTFSKNFNSRTHWEHFSHGSDIGVRGTGTSLSEAFEMVALAVTALEGNPDSVAAKETVEFQLRSEGLDFLLYDWINKLVYEMTTRKMLFGKFKVEIDSKLWILNARISGEPIDIHKHDLGVEVKGATFTELKVEQRKTEWICQCVVDV